MKRLLICLAFAFTPMTAAASPELANQWGNEASDLRERTASMIASIDMGLQAEMDDTYELDVYRFANTSAGLSVWIDQTEGPKDLGCIFRGMRAEADTQLGKLDDMSDPLTTRETLRRLSTMFADAEMIADAAQRRAPTPGLENKSHTQSCPASLDAAMRALR
jgi:hypothetical protein